MDDYQIHHDVFLSGSKENIIRMLNTAICSIGGSDIIQEDDDITTINNKACIDKSYTLINFLDEESKRDNPIQDELVRGQCDDNADYHVCISKIEECDGECTVSLGIYYHDWYASYNEDDWQNWAKDMTRLYNCKIVIDRTYYCNGAFEGITTYMFELKNGNIEQSCIQPVIELNDYCKAFDKLMEIDYIRYLQYKIEDFENKVAVMQGNIECMKAQLEDEHRKANFHNEMKEKH